MGAPSDSDPIYLILCFSFALFVIFRPSPVIESEPPYIALSMAANKLKRSVLCAFCVNGGGTNDRHFDKTCFAFMAFTRGNFCLAINLITKCHECSSVFNLSHYFYSFFCGDSSDSDPIYSLFHLFRFMWNPFVTNINKIISFFKRPIL